MKILFTQHSLFFQRNIADAREDIDELTFSKRSTVKKKNKKKTNLISRKKKTRRISSFSTIVRYGSL